jgi:hypothetical protein
MSEPPVDGAPTWSHNISYEVVLGDSFSVPIKSLPEYPQGETFPEDTKGTFHAFQYEFRPGSVARTPEGKCEVKMEGGSTLVTLTSAEDRQSSTAFEGRAESAKDEECMLIFRGDHFVLERLSTLVHSLNYVYDGPDTIPQSDNGPSLKAVQAKGKRMERRAKKAAASPATGGEEAAVTGLPPASDGKETGRTKALHAEKILADVGGVPTGAQRVKKSQSKTGQALVGQAAAEESKCSAPAKGKKKPVEPAAGRTAGNAGKRDPSTDGDKSSAAAAEMLPPKRRRRSHR